MDNNVIDMVTGKVTNEMIENNKSRQEYIEDNHLKWNDEGRKYREERVKRDLSLKDVAKKLGTSPTRIWRFEVGEPISQADHLKATYELLFDYLDIKHELFNIWEKHV